jgi:hypothetical protein
VAQVIGWSADEQRFAVRVYTLTSDCHGHEEGKDVFCKGYVDHGGKPFHGGLRLLAFERDRLVASLPLQDAEKCTPPKVAEARLAEAKKKLAALGIELERPGSELSRERGRPRYPVAEGRSAPYMLEYVKNVREKVEPEGTQETWLRGAQELHVQRGNQRERVWARKLDRRFSRAEGGVWEVGASRVFLSPSGETVVVLGYEYEGHGREMRHALRLLAVLSWAGGALEAY